MFCLLLILSLLLSPAWSQDQPTTSVLVEQNVVRLEVGDMRVPDGFEWTSPPHLPGQSVVGRRAEPFGVLAISVLPQSEKLTGESGRAWSESYLKSLDEEGLEFRFQEPVALSEPLPHSYLFLAKGQATGITRSTRVFAGKKEGQLLLVAAFGPDNARSLSTALNSFGKVSPSSRRAEMTQPEAFTIEDMAQTLTLVACAVFAFSGVLVTVLAALRNRMRQDEPWNPFWTALKFMLAVFWLQQAVGLWLLHQNGGTSSDLLLLAGWVSAGFAVLAFLPTALGWAWSRTR